MTAIKIRLEKVHKGLVFQILNMPEQMRGMPSFRSTDGYSIVSENCPELSLDGGDTIFIIGDEREKDHISVVELYYTNEERDQIYDKILKTFSEFVLSDKYKCMSGRRSSDQHIHTFQ